MVKKFCSVSVSCSEESLLCNILSNVAHCGSVWLSSLEHMYFCKWSIREWLESTFMIKGLYMNYLAGKRSRISFKISRPCSHIDLDLVCSLKCSLNSFNVSLLQSWSTGENTFWAAEVFFAAILWETTEKNWLEGRTVEPYLALNPSRVRMLNLCWHHYDDCHSWLRSASLKIRAVWCWHKIDAVCNYAMTPYILTHFCKVLP